VTSWEVPDDEHLDPAREDEVIERIRAEEYAPLSNMQLVGYLHPSNACARACACTGGLMVDGRWTRRCRCQLRDEAADREIRVRHERRLQQSSVPAENGETGVSDRAEAVESGPTAYDELVLRVRVLEEAITMTQEALRLAAVLIGCSARRRASSTELAVEADLLRLVDLLQGILDGPRAGMKL
jgi:hypothetical protein